MLFLQLLIGNYGLSYDQSKAQMAVWAILAAPLIISTDLRNIRPEFKEILQNEEIIKIDQDRFGIQGRKIYTVFKLINLQMRIEEAKIGEDTRYLQPSLHKYNFDFNTTSEVCRKGLVFLRGP